MSGNEAGDFAATVLSAVSLIAVATVVTTVALSLWDRFTRRRI